MLTQHHSSTELSPFIVKLLKKRNMSKEDIQTFFSWNLKELPNLQDLQDLEKASERIVQALQNNEIIGIFGDYDVDGTTSCALLYQFFKMLGKEVILIQPGRFIEGYGIHPPSVQNAFEKGIKVLITVDCGITNNEAALKAKELGIDLIITDHHKDVRESMPEAFAIINPNRRDEPADSPLTALAGVSVAFILCLEIKRLLEKKGIKVSSIYSLLQYVAIGTICDLAHLNYVNLRFVRHGLKQLLSTEYQGLRSFFKRDELERSFIPSEKLSFNIGPLINSKGRLDHPELALKLLISTDMEESRHLLSHLEICNNERKFIQNEVFQEAKLEVLKEIDSKQDHVVSIVYAAHWHEGVIGIVASKLVEEFKVPAIVFTNAEDSGIIKASARSAGDLNLFECLREEQDLYLKFGGHKAAAGLSMKRENFRPFVERIEGRIKKIPEIIRVDQESFDIEILPHDINLNLLKSLDLLEPYGQGNPKPKFRMKNFKVDSYKILKDKHIKWGLIGHGLKSKKISMATPIRLQGISFNYLGKWQIPHPEEIYKAQELPDVDLCAYFTLGINHFNGNKFIQLMIDKIVY